MAKKIILLSCDSLLENAGDDNLLIKELSKDYEVSTISWSSQTQWSNYDAVIIRSTWDYVSYPEKFLQTLKNIQLSGAKLFNSFSVINWNIHKFYLKELEDKGSFIVPTLFFGLQDKINIPSHWEGDRFILKPAISAGSFKTMVLKRSEIENGSYKTALFNGDWLLQPFIEGIKEGEISLIYFDKKFSHAALKVPKKGEFRVQEEFGGEVVPYVPNSKILKLAEEILELIDLPLLYARIDMVPLNDSFALMEIELIEPALYFKAHPEAAQNFHFSLSKYF